ncbi:MAG: type I secretion system permease/ATPase [Mesorhizobium sp.]|nr:MAG: type I secretion system permease/ATPase [Mesorhizobium sp.]TIO56534.1 MAG: type I secretion system permease/ATPase [Mesorhizobium sp.]TJV60897.1 MAG: type I secretion system permease/ATPase [Mesorhizobium sp.]
MTDDRDLPWDTFAEDLEAAMQEDDQGSPGASSEMPRRTLSSALQQHERAIDRTMKPIDNVVGQLHDVVARPEVRVGQDRRLPQADIRNAATSQPKARPAPEQATPPLPASQAKVAPAAVSASAATAQAAPAQSNVHEQATTPPSTTNSQVAAARKPEADLGRSAPALQEKRHEEKAHPTQQATPHSGRPSNPPGEMRPGAAHLPAAAPTPKTTPVPDRSNLTAQRQPSKPEPAPQPSTVGSAGAQAAGSTAAPERRAATQGPQAEPTRPAQEPRSAATIERQGAPADPVSTRPPPAPQRPAEPQAKAAPEAPAKPSVTEMKDASKSPGMITIEGDTGPIKVHQGGSPPGGGDENGRRGGGGGGGAFHKRLGPVDFGGALKAGLRAVKKNLLIVMMFTVACNMLVLAIPIYLFQISDRVLTSRSADTLIMLTVVIVGAVVLQAMFDALRRFILMRTAVEVAAQLGAPILSAAARAALNSNGKEYQVLGDLQQLRTFLTSGTLLSFLDAPMAPIMMLAVFLIHPHQGFIVATSALLLLAITLINQRATAAAFSEANAHQSKANIHLDSMSRNSQIINALAMIPEAVKIWGKDTANSLRAQVIAQDRNIVFASLSKAVRLLTQVTMLGWGAHLSIDGHLTGGMVIAASIIAGRALGPIEGAIEGWNHVVHARAAYGRIASLLQTSPLNFERLSLPRPEGRLDVERLLFVPQGTKRVVLNGLSFSLSPGDSLAIIGNSGAGKTTLGKMLVGSILPTSGNVRLDLMDLRNWDPRQFGENIGYLPQDVQLFPASIKANIARMRDDVTDAEIYQAAALADVHEMISTLPHGYETFVTADGAPLSGGQKQRVALARAFFGNPRLVVLDEPNSNLDSAGDAALERALQHAKENKITVITITQRPSLLKSVDKILLLVNGTVALFGMRQDVLQALASRGLSIEGGSFGHQIQ